MGMFDDVVLPEPFLCPACARPTTRFQSKDGACELQQLSPQDVDRFYALCPCRTWIEFKRKRPAPPANWRDDFELVSPVPSSRAAR